MSELFGATLPEAMYPAAAYTEKTGSFFPLRGATLVVMYSCSGRLVAKLLRRWSAVSGVWILTLRDITSCVLPREVLPPAALPHLPPCDAPDVTATETESGQHASWQLQVDKPANRLFCVTIIIHKQL